MSKVLFDIARGVSEWKALPEELVVDPHMNGRHVLPDISELVASILKSGQLQPVTIRKTAGSPVLVAGFSRWRAVSYINDNKLLPEPLRLRCSYTQLDEKQAFLANIDENRVRNATTPIDDAYNIQRLINVYQMSEAEAAEVYRTNKAWIRDRLALLELTTEAVTAVRAKRVVGPAVKAIAKLTAEQQKRVLAKPGPVTMADVKREAPAPAAKDSKPSLKAAIAMLLAECAVQPDVMVYEIHKDTIMALKAAL